MPNYYIFRSTNRTHEECLNKMLVGQKDNKANIVKNIKPGDIIFIHNVNQQFITGPFWAMTRGIRNIEPRAWNGDFPWQVRIEKKGELSVISKESFDKFGLEFVRDGVFLRFDLPYNIGKKLMEELGFEINYSENKILDYNPLPDVEIDIRLRFPTKWRCTDGHYVRSKNEVIIDDWLYNHNIAHAYEKKVKNLNMICDFCIKNSLNEDVYIEVWGLSDDKYVQRKEEKQMLYKKNNLKLINLSEQHIQNIDDVLENELRKFDIIIK